MDFLFIFEKLVSLIEKFGELANYLATNNGSVVVAGFAAMGGFFGGPVGAFFGGAAGTALNSLWAIDMTAAIDVLKSLSFIMKEAIVNNVMALVGFAAGVTAGVAAVAALVAFMADKENRYMIYKLLKKICF